MEEVPYAPDMFSSWSRVAALHREHVDLVTVAAWAADVLTHYSGRAVVVLPAQIHSSPGSVQRKAVTILVMQTINMRATMMYQMIAWCMHVL